MTGQVLSNSNQSDPFKISNRVKQGCVLAPVLFNLFFTCVLNYTVQGLDEGVYICYHFDGSIFNLCQLTAKSKTLTDLIQAALFADDCTLMAHKSSDLQTMLNRFSDASKLFGLTISLGKTEVLFQPAPNSSAPQPTITIDSMEMKTVKSFKYLGSMISSHGQLDKEISVRISKASQVLGRLCNWGCSHTTMCPWPQSWNSTRAVVLTSLLYGCESWTIYCTSHQDSWKSSICEHSIPSWVSDGRTKSPILKSWTKPSAWSDFKLLAKYFSTYISRKAVKMQRNLMLLKAASSQAGLATSSADGLAKDVWWVQPKQLFFGELAQGLKKTRLSHWKWLQGHTEEEPEMVWHQAFQTQHSSPGPPPLACAHMHSKCITGKGADEQNSLQPTIITTELLLPLPQQWPSSVPPASRLCKSRLGLQSHSRVHWQEHRPSHSWIQETTTIMLWYMYILQHFTKLVSVTYMDGLWCTVVLCEKW